jgi:recombination protein RecT
MTTQTQPVPGTKTGQTQPPAKITPKNIVDDVLAKVNKFQELGELRIPKDYSPENALKSAYLVLSEMKDKNEKPVLEICSHPSIANALLKMVTEGLSIMKHQCSFIAYGSSLTYQREYQGSRLLAKRFGGVKEVNAQIIYEGDDFQYKVLVNGRKEFVKHDQNYENIDLNKIKGAYAIAVLEDGTTDLEIMNIMQIRAAWNMGYAKGNSKAHQQFADEMAKKTVISRLCKKYINSSDDSALFDEDDERDVYAKSSKETITENANKETISFDEAEVIKEPTKAEKTENEPAKQHAAAQQQVNFDNQKEPSF